MPVQRQKRRHHPLLPVRRFFHVGDIADLEKQFEGVPRTPEALTSALAHVPVEQWFVGGERGPLLDFLCRDDDDERDSA